MRPAAVFALAVAVAAASCNGTRADEGLDASLVVHGAQFFRGPMPSENGGPTVASTNLALSHIRAGQQDAPFMGALSKSATAAAIGLEGDRGYWIVTAGAPDPSAPTFPSFDAPLSFSPTLGPGGYDVDVRGVDAAGHFGPAVKRHVELTDSLAIPDGKLVVSLSWDTESDLDLHVVDPQGVEVFYRNINSWQPPPPGEPVDPNAWKTGGILDFDSNADCVIDGRRLENVVWTAPPPSGHYLVRVDAKSLCAQVDAHWKVDVRLAGTVIAHATGTSLESDTQVSHDRGAGVLAVEFDVP